MITRAARSCACSPSGAVASRCNRAPSRKPGQVELVPLHWRPFLVVGEAEVIHRPTCHCGSARPARPTRAGTWLRAERNAVERFAGGQPGLGQGCRDDLPGSRQGLIPVLHIAEVSAQRVPWSTYAAP